MLAGCGANNTAESIRLSQSAQAAGADGVLLVTPYYHKPTQEGLFAHYQAVAQSIDLPVVLYNVPGRTGVNLLPTTVSQLAAIPNIVAIKEEMCIRDRYWSGMKLLRKISRGWPPRKAYSLSTGCLLYTSSRHRCQISWTMRSSHNTTYTIKWRRQSYTGRRFYR